MRYSAGILPYAFIRGRMYVLIGKDVRDNTWSDFGGKSEDVDGCNPVETAIREFYEETCGVVMDLKSLRNRMSVATNYTMLVSQTQNFHPYYMYLLEVPYNTGYRSIFRKLLYFMKYKKIYKKFMEKTDIQWISVDSLVNRRVMLRSVFEATIDKHIDAIRKFDCVQRAVPFSEPTA
jgi:hypothetical protein